MMITKQSEGHLRNDHEGKNIQNTKQCNLQHLRNDDDNDDGDDNSNNNNNNNNVMGHAAALCLKNCARTGTSVVRYPMK
jgi:hypothetical protein